MTQPQDPRKTPLQDDEVALARVLRALPSGEPPAALDTAILRAATDAVTPGRRKPARGLRWLPTWAIGTAAAAVLAVGVGIQLRPPLAPKYEPAGVQEKAPMRPEARERLEIGLVEPEQAAAPPPAPAPPEPARRTGRPPPPPPAPVAPAPQAPPSPVLERQAQAMPAEAEAPAPAADIASEDASTLDIVEVTGSRLRSEATDQARRVHQESYARRAQAKAAQERDAQAQARGPTTDGYASPPAGASAEAAPPSVAAAPPAAFTDTESGNRAAILPPVAEDARLAPSDWFERIRERRRQGDIAGARASLQLFLKAHPDAPLPNDLARLR